MLTQNIHFPADLPITEKIKEIQALIESNPVIVIAGETGSGKTTQIPKLCLAMGRGMHGKKIGHTQPRRIAARSVATRIAEELKVPLGSTVGFKMRFSDKTHATTAIKVMTDGILLAETQSDPFLRQYDTIIIDEAHERSLNIDFLLGLLKNVLEKRHDLKVIITSATIDLEKFSRYFNNAPIIEVSGRMFPVEIRYRPLLGELEKKTIDQTEGIIAAVEEATTLGMGDILVFLSSEREIRETAEALSKHHLAHTEILPLYARLSAREQHKVFEPHTGRRIILATNVAETSVTVPGIQFVIDTGMARISRYNYRSQVQRLPIEAISKASANQRSGRCGRVMAGICFRLYAEEEFLLRPEFSDPEILRTHLSAVILHMLAIGLGDIEDFPFLEAPDIRHIREGIRLLEQLGAITKLRALTDFGRQLSHLPVDPKIGAMILAAAKENCLSEILIIASALTIQDPRERPLEFQQAADLKHIKYKQPWSDFLSYLTLWETIHKERDVRSKNKFKNWCQTEFLSFSRIQDWIDIHHQLNALMTEMGYRLNDSPAKGPEIHRALLTGLISNIGNITEKKNYIGIKDTKFQIFPGSALFEKPPKWIMAFELVETQRVYARVVGRIEPEWIETVAGHLLKINYREPHWEKKAGHVMALSRATLYGLTVYDSRRVIYDKIDPVLSREVFIRAALVEGDFESTARFFQENRSLMDSVEALEDKARRRDILVDEETLFEFYDKRIPMEITNRPELEQWLKTIDEEILMMTENDLMRHDAKAITEQNYPSSISINGMVLPLTYHFEPGSINDGVTVKIPILALKQLSDSNFIGLVPGLLLAKIEALIKSLPKNYRRNFVPIREYALVVLEKIVGTDKVLEQISEALTKMSGVVIPMDAWDVNSIPEHLRMNFSVVSTNGEVLTTGRELSTLVLDSCLVSKGEENIDEIQKTLTTPNVHLSIWPEADIPQFIEINTSGVFVKSYPALVDCGEGVMLKNISSLSESHALHRKGVRRLILISEVKTLKQWSKSIINLNTMVLQYGSIGTKQNLLDDLITAGVESAFLSDYDLPRTRVHFETCLIQGRPRLGLILKTIVELIGLILKHYQIVVGMPSIQDTQQQLKHLIYPGFISETPLKWLKRYPLYLKAIELRLVKYCESKERDTLLQHQLDPHWKRCLERLEINPKIGEENANWVEYRWMIEEFRISIFAQTLGTLSPISAKRLEVLWQKCN